MKKKFRKRREDDSLTLLQDIQLERGFLCSIFEHGNPNTRIKAYSMFLADEDFVDDNNRETWILMRDCVDNGQQVNLLNVYAHAAKVGKKWDMSRYIQVNGSEADMDTMAITISTMGIKRRLCDELKTIVMDIEYNGSLVPEQVLSDIESVVDLASRKVKPKTISWLKIYSSLISDYEKLANGELITGIKSGFDIIDKKGGFELGELMVIGARTSNGKTAFALNCAVNVALHGTPVGIFSLEMTNKQLGMRIVSILSQLNASLVKQGRLTENHLRVFTSLDDSLPIYFDDVRSSEIDTIIQNIKTMVLQHDVKVVVLDYLQLMRSREIDRVHQIGGIAHRLEALSKQLEITIILISQLRRNNERDPCPRLEELKESGDIADAADSIYLIYRPEQHGQYFRYPQLSKDWSNVEIAGTAMIMCVKNRQGEKTGEEIVGFDAQTTRFYELSYLKTIQNKSIIENKDKIPF